MRVRTPDQTILGSRCSTTSTLTGSSLAPVHVARHIDFRRWTGEQLGPTKAMPCAVTHPYHLRVRHRLLGSFLFVSFFSASCLGLIFFGQQERGHRAVGLRDNPQLVASVCAIGAQEPEPVL